MCFIERETQNFSLKFSHWEKQSSVPSEWNLMKSRVSVKFMRFFEKNGTCCDWQVFFFTSESFLKIFLTQGYHW